MCRQTSRTAAVFITETLGRSFDTVAHLASYAGLAPWPDAQDHPSGASTSRTRVTRDPNGAWYTSGIRLGTPALTSRGFSPDDMDKVAGLICEALTGTRPATTSAGAPGKAKYDMADGLAARVHAEADELLGATPLCPGLEL